MRNMFRLLSVLLLSLFMLHGCSQGHSSTDYGSARMAHQMESKAVAEKGLHTDELVPLLPRNWQDLVVQSLRGTRSFLSPQTAQITFPVSPRYCSFSNNRSDSSFLRRDTGDQPVVGYCGLASVPSRNAFGSFTRVQYFFLLSGGKVVISGKNPENTWISLEQLAEQILWDSDECLLLRH